MRRLVHGVVSAGLLCAASAQAGSFLFNFNSDPLLEGLFAVTGNGYWSSSGGVGSATNSEDGYLVITDARGQGTRIIFSDFDEGSVVQAFTFECDLRIGNGSSTPADGFSVNFCRASDPVLTGGAFAQGQNCEANLPEEGTQTGIAIGFDAYDSGGTAGSLCDVVNQNIGVDVAAVTVRVDGTLVLQKACPSRNTTCEDATSIQTGPYDASGSPEVLCWAHLKVQLTADAKLSVWWKGQQILTDYQTTYYPSPGRLVFAGRTGDLWQNQQVDNIKIDTIAAALATLGTATGSPDGFSVTVSDSGSSVVDPATAAATATLDGVAVTGVTATKSGTTTTFTYHGFPTLLVPGSTHAMSISFKDANGNTISGDRSFTVPAYATIPAADAVTGVDTSKVGFRIKPWQSSTETATQPNTTIWTLEQLLGLHGDNNADLATATDNGYIDYTGVINFNINAGNGDAGNFQTSGGFADSLFPGIPGANGLTGNSAIEVMCYMQFAAPGVYYLGVNSDDGFLVTEGKNPKDWFGLKLGEFSGGRGASDTIFPVAVPTAGIYPIRLTWENGNGELPDNGANCEFFCVKDGVKYLINDPASTSTTGIQAFYGNPRMPAYQAYVTPYSGATGVWPTNVVTWLMDEGTTVTAGSIQFYMNGATVTPVVTKSGTKTTINMVANYTNAATSVLFVDGLNTAAVTWTDSAGATHSNAWRFTVVPHQPLPENLWTAIGSGSNPGVRMRVFQSMATNMVNGWKNTIQMANQAIEGFYTPNIADPSFMTNNGYCWLTDAEGYVDFAQNNGGSQGTAGNFNNDRIFPGLPGTNVTELTGTTTPMDFNAAEFLTYLEFSTPGVYYMAVSSDDGFRVTCAEKQTRKSMLTVTAPAAIAKDLPAMMTQSGMDGAAYGAALPTTPLVAQLVVADPLLAGAAGTVLNNAAAIKGKVALIQRGTYGFVDKCSVAEAAGAVAVIVCNNEASAGLQPGIMGGSGTVNIPCLFISYSDGTNLIANATTDTNSPVVVSIGDDGSFKCGEANYGKGASDIFFPVTVAKAGVYPFRLMWENGNGDANCEWFVMDLTSGTKTLVNDPNGATVKAFITRTGVAPTLSLTKSGSAWTITYTGTLQSCGTVDGVYQDVAGAASPYVVPVNAGQMQFYRTRQ